MSDEFLKVATKEINNELLGIIAILNTCQDDSDMSKNSESIEAHMHKIKGLAPMMGKESIGELAKSLDIILKNIIAGKQIDGFLHILSSSVDQMKISMEKPNDLESIQKEISDIAAKIVD